MVTVVVVVVREKERCGRPFLRSPLLNKKDATVVMVPQDGDGGGRGEWTISTQVSLSTFHFPQKVRWREIAQ